MSEAEPSGSLQIPILWIGVEDLPLTAPNQFVGQSDGDWAYLTIGALTPPMLLGTPEEQEEAATRLGYVQVRPIARMALTRKRLVELRDILNATIENHDFLSRGDAG